MSLSISSSSSSSRLPSVTFPEPLYQVKLLSALRSGVLSSSLYSARRINHCPTLGDPAVIHPFLAGLGKGHHDGGGNDHGAAALHLAVRCASGVPFTFSLSAQYPYSTALAETVSLLLGQRSILPNAVHPPASGTTALHLAASLGRADVVNLLLEHEDIDDTLRDSNGKTCIDVARGKDVLSVINGTSSHISS